MARTRAWYYDGVAIGGATGKTHTLTTGQTDSSLIECRTEVDFGADSVAALAGYVAAASVLDDFNRADENLEASANWDIQTGIPAGSSQVVSNQLYSSATDSRIAYEHVDTRANDQWAELEYVSSSGSTVLFGPAVRLSYGGSGYTCYTAEYNPNSSQVLLRRVVDGSYNTRATYSQSLSPGDVLKIECIGTTIEAFVNGSSIGSVIEATIASGKAGFIGYLNSANTTWDNFDAGDS